MKHSSKCVRLYTDKHLETIGSMFKALYKDELLTDCTLHCKDGSIKAHKLILAASSLYFRQVFLKHNEEHSIFIMYGISAGPLKDLLELIYKGSIDVPGETLGAVFDLADELQVTGVLAEDGSTDTKHSCGRDTRYKGQKRVAVDFAADEHDSVPAKVVKNANERRSSSSSERGVAAKKTSDNSSCESQKDESSPDPSDDSKLLTCETSSSERFVGHSTDEQSSLSVWARKERKFKCDLCPSRHQLVHTGERPFACDQCDKAFSRHDKLKHHIHKAHELGPLNDALPPDSLYTIGHVHILTPEQTMTESPEPIVQTAPPPAPIPLPSPPQKKGRGRPRKYPIVPPPLVKRPRGRPRLNPIIPQEPPPRRENYDISNMPYGDIEYLTKPLTETNEVMAIHGQEIMEPLVEIKTEPTDKSDLEREKTGTFLENIGLFENSAIAKIGECTISVANSSNST